MNIEKKQRTGVGGSAQNVSYSRNSRRKIRKLRPHPAALTLHIRVNESLFHDDGSPLLVPPLRFLKRRAFIMLEPVPHDIAVNPRPCGVSFPNDEAVSGDGSHTIYKLRTELCAEVVQPQFEVFLLLRGDVWILR